MAKSAKTPAKSPAAKTTKTAPASKTAKAAAKPAPKKAAAGGAATGLKAPLTPSETLAKVVGNKPMPRTEVTKRVWEYIRKNDLQDKKNRRMINTDDNLKAVCDGVSQLSMFELPKALNKHLK
ncbi:SWIB/MDM2 domain-containing protein [Chitinophaga sp. GCM10012297]|uniref:DM2 domain-containing protein n=1 Tax=Chitinophaga chungangae TaxID=2821488 RepID=A0ABS3YBL7_9BACT|nr:SWIB/MDM2 domain-containing protein [Chitinophaga chungangae]MBO9151733.1 hypothetical protein [Chitinophaga chungangae]